MTTTAAFWDSLADKYSKQPIANVPAWERKKQETKARLQSGDLVLDVGCGTGSLALELAPHAGHVHGVDLSVEMVRIAEGKAKDAGVDNVTFHPEPFDSVTSFGDGSFDMVCAYSILHLVPDLGEALAAMHRLLEPGGWLISSTVCLGGSLVPYGVILPLMRMLGKAPPVTILSRSELVDAVQAAGFVEVEMPDVGANKTTVFMLARKPA